jgi:hypothetical protein
MASRIPDAADLRAEVEQAGLRFQILELNRLMREAAQKREFQCVFTAPFRQNAVDILEAKGYTVTHDGTAYTIDWSQAVAPP